MWMNTFFACMSDDCRGQRSGEGFRAPIAGVMDGREPPRGCWELNHSPLREQQMLLIAEPTLQPVIFIIFSYVCGCVCL